LNAALLLEGARRRSPQTTAPPGDVVGPAGASCFERVARKRNQRTGTFPKEKSKQCLCQRFAGLSATAFFGCLHAWREGTAGPQGEAAFCAAPAHFFCRTTARRLVDVALVAR
jgi:hypothetical protein